MKARKILSFLMAMLLLGVCFVACDQGGGEDITTPEDPTETPTEEPTQETTEPSTEQTSDEATTEEETTRGTVNDAPIGDILKYDTFDLNTYMAPVWDGRVVYNETVMFVGMDDKASLLYTPDEILSVRSYDLKTVYEQGKDYDVVDGQLVLLEGTRIPVISFEQYYHEKEIPGMPAQLVTKYEGKNYYTYWGEGTTMTQWQVAVTYVHDQYWEGFVPEHSNQFARLIAKLEAGEDVTMIFYGDSITWGATSSGLNNVHPYAPSWSQLFTQFIAQKYGYTVKYVNTKLPNVSTPPAQDSVFGTNGTITYINPSVGGWTSVDGTNKFDQYVKPFVEEYGCDFFALAFGMNDAANSPNSEKKAIKKIADQVYAVAPETDLMLVATMIPNPEATNGWYGNQHRFETVFEQLAKDYVEDGKACGVACVTSMSQRIVENKRFRDHTGNNINHPNDFLSRIYAQVAFETVIGYGE
ncbi:MAG: SGNH/GDSL hydrolase family protein [Clostridia bacterium]|nr:SGNH/GDSL hydrolase family protein [Clostridia bacterium]